MRRIDGQDSRGERSGADPVARGAGFTLIEMMAVVAIMAMVFTFAVPQLSSSQWRVLRNEAESIATSLEFTRQRAIMTGVPHRLRIDLEEGGYRVEWLATEDEAMNALLGTGGTEGGGGSGAGGLLGGLGGPGGGLTGDGDELLAPGEEEPIDLHPPPHPDREFHPVPNRAHGSFTWIDERLYFVGLESPDGWVEGGDVAIVFAADGTTDYALLELADAEDHHMTLEIEPLLDRIRRRNGRARS